MSEKLGFSYERLFKSKEYNDADEVWWLVHIALTTGACNDYMFERFTELLNLDGGKEMIRRAKNAL